MAFWGAEVTPGQTVPFVPPPEGSRLHLSQAALAKWSSSGKQKAAITCKTQECNPLRICCLHEAGNSSANLDLVFDHYTEFQVEGAPVHLTGYHMPTHIEEEDDDAEYDLEGVPPSERQALQQQLAWERAFDDFEEDDSEEDEDYNLDDAVDSDDESSSDEEAHQPSVVIEELTENGDGQGRQHTTLAQALLAAEEPSTTPTSSQNGVKGDKPKKTARFSGLDPSQLPASRSTPAEVATPPLGAASEPISAEAGKKTSKKKRKAGDAGSTPAVKPSGLDKGASAAAFASQGTPQPAKASQKLSKDTSTATASADSKKSAEISASKKQKVRRFENGFEYENQKLGPAEGKLAKPGLKVVVRYQGRLQKTGKVFDESKGKGFTFRLGVGEVIKGWDLGVNGMRVGDKRKLTIPPQLAYGSSGVKGAIPANATLVFDVELADVKSSS